MYTCFIDKSRYNIISMVAGEFQILLRLCTILYIGLLGGCVASLSFTLTCISPSLCWSKFNLYTPPLCDRRAHQSHVVSHNNKSLMILIAFSRCSVCHLVCKVTKRSGFKSKTEWKANVENISWKFNRTWTITYSFKQTGI